MSREGDTVEGVLAAVGRWSRQPAASPHDTMTSC